MIEENPQNQSLKETRKEDDAESSLLVTDPQIKAEIDNLMKDLPPQKQEQILHIFREKFVGIFDRSSSKLDPELIKTVTTSIDRDNENKFKYLTQKQENEAKQKEREHQLSLSRHEANSKVINRLVLASILLVFVCAIAGIALIFIGQDKIGFSILSLIVGAFFGFLGGLGAKNLFTEK